MFSILLSGKYFVMAYILGENLLDLTFFYISTTEKVRTRELYGER